jgi:hypothetical protein
VVTAVDRSLVIEFLFEILAVLLATLFTLFA